MVLNCFITHKILYDHFINFYLIHRLRNNSSGSSLEHLGLSNNKIEKVNIYNYFNYFLFISLHNIPSYECFPLYFHNIHYYTFYSCFNTCTLILGNKYAYIYRYIYIYIFLIRIKLITC